MGPWVVVFPNAASRHGLSLAGGPFIAGTIFSLVLPSPQLAFTTQTNNNEIRITGFQSEMVRSTADGHGSSLLPAFALEATNHETKALGLGRPYGAAQRLGQTKVGVRSTF